MFSFPLWSLHFPLQLLVAFNTTRFPFFAECPRHSAKNTRRNFSRQSRLCRVSFIGHSAKVLPSAQNALGKKKETWRRAAVDGGFAECRWRKAHGKVSIFAVCQCKNTWRIRDTLPCANAKTLGEVTCFHFFVCFLAAVSNWIPQTSKTPVNQVGYIHLLS